MGGDNTTDGERGLLQRVLHESRLVRELERVDAGSSRLVSTGKRAIQGSWLYQWLTKEPEPEVIVIDLRETWTVGPIIRLLDWTLERLSPYWQGSTLKRLFDGTVAVLERAAETKVGKVFAALLAPPEPPERASEHENARQSEPDAASTAEVGTETGSEPDTDPADERDTGAGESNDAEAEDSTGPEGGEEADGDDAEK